MIEIMTNANHKGVKQNLEFDFSCVSHGQVQAKLWLCDEIEKVSQREKRKSWSIRIYGSWFGLLPLLLLSRQQMPVRHFDLYDIDPLAHQTAQKFLNYWLCEGSPTFAFHTQDVNTARAPGSDTDLVINTSCEHMDQTQWWENIPVSTLFCLQSTNMEHSTHTNRVFSTKDWKRNLSLSHSLHFEGEKKTTYDTFSFERYMLIGRKVSTRHFFKRF